MSLIEDIDGMIHQCGPGKLLAVAAIVHHADPLGVSKFRWEGMILECSTYELLTRTALTHQEDQGHIASRQCVILKGPCLSCLHRGGVSAEPLLSMKNTPSESKPLSVQKSFRNLLSGIFYNRVYPVGLPSSWYGRLLAFSAAAIRIGLRPRLSMSC